MKTNIFITTENEGLLCVDNMLDFTLHEYVEHGMHGQGAYVRTYTVDVPHTKGTAISHIECERLRNMQKDYKLELQKENNMKNNEIRDGWYKLKSWEQMKGSNNIKVKLLTETATQNIKKRMKLIVGQKYLEKNYCE